MQADSSLFSFRDLSDWLPFRWHPIYCLVGLHNPVYRFDHELCERQYVCWHCLKRLA